MTSLLYSSSRRHPDPLIEQPNFRRATLFAPPHHRLEQYLLAAEMLLHPLDLLHSTDFIPPLHAQVKSIITVHDLAFLHYPHFLTAESAGYYGRSTGRPTMPATSSCLASSPARISSVS